MTAREQWDGGEWQEHCRRLLGARYGENVQFVPDRVGGDGGLEAYRLDCGTVYQCYAPEDAFTVQAQTDAQKNKIQRDIFKLVSKPDETVELLGDGYLITRWVLLTPECDDKEILKYARDKSFKTRSAVPRPPWCDEAFEIVVATDRDLFPVELAQLTAPAAIIRLNVPEMTDEDIYASIEEGVAARLTEKLSAYPPLKADETVLTSYRSEILYDYLYGRQQLAILEDRYSLAYSAVDQRARTTLRAGSHEVPVPGPDEPGPRRQGPHPLDQPLEGGPERLRHHLMAASAQAGSNRNTANGIVRCPIMAAARRPSTSFVLATLRALHADCHLAGGTGGTYRTMPTCIPQPGGPGATWPRQEKEVTPLS